MVKDHILKKKKYSYLPTEKCDPIVRGVVTAKDQVLAVFALEVLRDYPGLPGLFVVGIFSASLSTVSSGVNALAAVVLDDCLKLFWHFEDEARVAKWLALTFGVLAMGMAYLAAFLGQIIQLAYSLFGMISGPLVGLFLMGMLLPWPNANGAFVGFLSALALSLYLGAAAKFSGAMIARPPR